MSSQKEYKQTTKLVLIPDTISGAHVMSGWGSRVNTLMYRISPYV